MKKAFILLFLTFTFAVFSFSQTITGVTSKLEGKQIVVNYNITGATAGQTFDVTLWYGTSKTTCSKQAYTCVGDVGEGVTAGTAKKITWTVTDDLEKLNGSYYFTVKAEIVQPEPTTGTLRLISEIAGSYYIDGTYKKTVVENSTTTTTDLSAGKHTLKITGTQNWTETVYITAGETTEITAEKAVTTGTLKLTTEIAGKFYIDNVFRKTLTANTVETVTDLEAGTYTIKIAATPEFTQTVTIKANETTSVTAKATVVVTTEIKDGDGNTYSTVVIGTQTWLKENLKTTKYNDGTAIPNVTDNTAWTKLTTAAYCWYDNNATTYKATYGALYNWYAVDKASNGNKNICPTGYHVPTDNEWTTLITYLGGTSEVGGKMKETGTTHWASPNMRATNSSGFTGLPSGYRSSSSGTFYDVSDFGYFWSSTACHESFAWYRYLRCDYAYCDRNYKNIRFGFSVRCAKD